MSHKVFILPEAEQDLFEIYKHVYFRDSRAKANRLLKRLENSCQSLKAYPQRGHVPPELERISVTQYREIHYKPYRIIYEWENRHVHIHAVLDGRRSLQELLERRLFRQ